MTADVQSRSGVAFAYTGALVDSNGDLLNSLDNLAASGSFDGGASTSTGITIEAGDFASHFDLSITAAAMEIDDQAVITITADGAQTLELTIRTGKAKQFPYGIPIDKKDAQAGGTCEETGLLCPASRMKRLDGRRVADFVDFITPD